MKKDNIVMSCVITFFCMFYANGMNNMDPITKIMDSYIELVNAMEKENSAAKVLDLYSDRYSGNTTYLKLSGAIVKKSYTKEDIRAQLNDILQDEDYTFTIKMNKVLYRNQKEDAGTISALLDFESFIDNKIAEKGTMLINIVAGIQNGQWKIIQNNMVRVSEAKDIGVCVCHIYEKGGTRFLTELYYPAGVEYAHKFETFRIISNEKSRAVKAGGQTFVWEKGSDKIMLDQEELGIVKNPKQVIELLIKKMNTEPCATIIFR